MRSSEHATHTHTSIHIHTYTCSRTYKHTYRQAHTDAGVNMLPHTHTHTMAHTYTCLCTYLLAHTPTNIPNTGEHAHIHAHTDIQARTNKTTHTHRDTCTATYTIHISFINKKVNAQIIYEQVREELAKANISVYNVSVNGICPCTPRCTARALTHKHCTRMCTCTNHDAKTMKTSANSNYESRTEKAILYNHIK